MIFPFYDKARALFIKTQDAQIRKGLQKYPEPFNPRSWKPKQLLNHALEEAVDLVHYIVGLHTLIEDLEAENERLRKILYRREEKPNMNFEDTPKPPYADLDD